MLSLEVVDSGEMMTNAGVRARNAIAMRSHFRPVPNPHHQTHITNMKPFTTIWLTASLLGVSTSHRSSINAQDVVKQLNLSPNPEKGYYRQTFEDSLKMGNRSASTAIYYLLEGSSGTSYWHRVTDAVEIWHYYAGCPMKLELSWNNGTATQAQILGSDIFKNQTPQVVIEKGRWQRATSLGNWTLVGTTVAPGFSENGYELPAPGFEVDEGR
jgi:predicted cupin superfamily sugar epimerase